MPKSKDDQRDLNQKNFDKLLDDTKEDLEIVALDILAEEEEALDDNNRDDDW